MAELIDIVDETNNVIGIATQEEIYAKKLPHRIVHVFVLNPKTKQIYFQQRAETKSFLPGYYCTSAGGHVRAGESYESAAKRELKEELGLSVSVKKAASLQFISDNHMRFIELFLAYAEGGFNFEDGEVISGKFLSLDEAYNLVNKNVKIHPQLKLCYNWLYNIKERIE